MNDHSATGWGIAVVHGVGSPKPGATLKRVCKGIETANPHITFQEAPTSGPHLHEMAGALGKQRIRAVEAYWGDISLVRKNAAMLTRALFVNLFGLRFICAAALAEAPGILRILCALPFQLVRLVIVPVHLLAFGLALPIGLRLWFSPDASIANAVGTGAKLTDYPDMFLALCVAFAVAGLVAAICMTFIADPVRSKPWDMALSFTLLALISASFSGPALLSYTEALPSHWLASHSLADWVDRCLAEHPTRPHLGPLEVLSSVAMLHKSLSEGVCLLITSTTPVTEDITGIGKYLALNEFIGDSAFFAITLDVLAVLPLMVWQVVRGNAGKRRGAILALTVTMLFVVVTAIVLEPIDVVVRLVQYLGRPNVGAYWYELILVPWIIAVVGATVAVILYRQALVHWGSRKLGAPPQAPVTYPRLIVSNVFQAAVISSTSVLMLVFLVFEKIPQQFYTRAVSARLVAPVALALVVAAIASSERLRRGLNFAMDVINHFTDPKRNYPVRREIAKRFSAALDHLLADERTRRLVIVAHSQGTVITLEAFLRDLWEQRLKGRIDTLTIMTFGSPWTHIYQHYFPAQYPTAAGASFIDLARQSSVRWLNTFRLDDAIGTEVTVHLADFPQRLPMANGGHGHYWEKDVLGCSTLLRYLPSAEGVPLPNGS